MNNIFENAYFGKPYKTRDERSAIYQSGDDEFHHLFLSSCDIIVDNHGYLYCKEIPSGLDIISAWQEPIDEEELDKLAMDNTPTSVPPCFNYRMTFQKGFKVGFRKAMEGII